MAVVSNSFLSCLIDTSFDIDEALTLPDHFGHHQISTSNSLQIIADMPTVVNITEDIVCAICMDGFQSGIGGKSVPCGHLYHEACISSWLADYDSCPLCRSNIISGKESLSGT